MSIIYRTFAFMRRKEKKKRLPITEDNVKRALDNLPEDYVGEVIPGVQRIKLGEDYFVLTKEGAKALTDLYNTAQKNKG